MNGNRPKLNRTLFDICNICKCIFNYICNSIQIQQKKPHWYGSNIYVVTCISKLSATSWKVEMHTLHTLVDMSLLFPFANGTLVKCMFSKYECMFFEFVLLS